MTSDPVVPHDSWEWMWAPYDAPTYSAVLDTISRDDVVLEIGAGDCRLARAIAHRAHKVYALEWNTRILEESRNDLPSNCHVIVGDARWIAFPQDVTLAVLLMRHCTHFYRYWSKLVSSDCRLLITNARWGMGIEAIELQRPRRPYDSLSIGWYACCCGQAGFVINDKVELSAELIDLVWEVKACPSCVKQ